MKNSLALIAAIFFIAMTIPSPAQPARKDLLTAVLARQNVSKVEIKLVTMPAGQAAPKHVHPCPVVGYIVSGRVRFTMEGEETQILRAGDAFYEPKNKVILQFDNDATDEPLTFIACYLKEENEDLVKLLK